VSVRRLLEPNSLLLPSVHVGKQALERAHRDRIVETDGRRVVDSLNLDATMMKARPREHRWDYLIGTTHPTLVVVGVEIHPATAGETKVMIAKKEAALHALKAHCTAGRSVKRWVWVSSGTTAITKSSREARQLVANGIRLVGKTLNLAVLD
jgi:hypothetical protein